MARQGAASAKKAGQIIPFGKPAARLDSDGGPFPPWLFNDPGGTQELIWETYKGKKIFNALYGHLSIEDYRAEVAAVEKEMLKQPKNSVLLLVDTSGRLISPEALILAKNVALHSQPYVRNTAILGMSGARRALPDVVAKFSGMKVTAFDTAQQAKDFLVRGYFQRSRLRPAFRTESPPRSLPPCLPAESPQHHLRQPCHRP